MLAQEGGGKHTWVQDSCFGRSALLLCLETPDSFFLTTGLPDSLCSKLIETQRKAGLHLQIKVFQIKLVPYS